MERRGLVRLGAVGLALLVLYCNFATAKSADWRSAVEDVKGFHLSQKVVSWALGDYFDRTEGLPAAVVLALRTSPLLYAYHAELTQPAPEASAAALPHLYDAGEPTEVPTAETQTMTFADNGVPAQTVLPKAGPGYTMVDGVFIKNSSDKTLDVTALQGPFAARLSPDAPQVLIVHTHGSESYTPPPGQSYVSTGNYRTSDARYSVVGVGDEIAVTLSGSGISVLHDRTLYDDPLYDGAYERAAEGIRGYLEKYPSITFVLDVHRDAVQDSAGSQYKLISREDPNAAQVSFVMGSNHDGWEENLKLAIAVSRAAMEKSPTLMRPITLRNANYNQHLTSGSLLVEVGAAGNSPDEALRAGRLLAEALATAILQNESQQ